MAKNLGVKIIGPAQSSSAWGMYTREISIALYNAGINVNLIDATQPSDFPAKLTIKEKELMGLVSASQNNPMDRNNIAIHVNSPEKISFTDNNAIANIAWTGVDVDDLPMVAAAMLSNPAIKQIWVPSSWQKDVFDKHSALKSKTRIVNFGVNNKKIEAAKDGLTNMFRDTFNFCHVGSLKAPGGLDILIKAFYEEFKDDEKVNLILKLFLGNVNKGQEKEVMDKYIGQYKNGSKAKVLFVSGTHTEEAVNSIIASTHCYVSAARGKHWNNPILKAMAAERPVIANGLAGNRQYTNQDNSFQVSSRKMQISNIEWLMQNPLYQGASWFETNPEDLKKAMRNVVNLYLTDKPELQKIADKAKQKALKLDWDNVAMEILKNIKEYEPKNA